MVEAREDLALGAEAPHDRVGVHPAFEDLDGDALVEHVVVAHGEEHGAHAALPQLAHQPVGADARVGALDVGGRGNSGGRGPAAHNWGSAFSLASAATPAQRSRALAAEKA